MFRYFTKVNNLGNLEVSRVFEILFFESRAYEIGKEGLAYFYKDLKIDRYTSDMVFKYIYMSMELNPNLKEDMTLLRYFGLPRSIGARPYRTDLLAMHDITSGPNSLYIRMQKTIDMVKSHIDKPVN